MAHPYEAVWALVRTIPSGRVMTYGQVATLLGSPRGARQVGFAMFYAGLTDVPWHRVVNARGEISPGGHPDRPAFCAGLQPSAEMCGNTREQAMFWLAELERVTAPL